jgi:hypothetical protein
VINAMRRRLLMVLPALLPGLALAADPPTDIATRYRQASFSSRCAGAAT